jgi:addiction module HigA family antidote
MNEEIRIEDLASMDFSDVTADESVTIPPTRPGDILLHDFMEPLKLSANALARELVVPANRVSAILAGTRGVSADTALRLARYFGTTPEFWMGLQASYDLKQTINNHGDAIARQVHPRATR